MPNFDPYPANLFHGIGLRENLEETPTFHGQNHVFPGRFSQQNQSTGRSSAATPAGGHGRRRRGGVGGGAAASATATE